MSYDCMTETTEGNKVAKNDGFHVLQCRFKDARWIEMRKAADRRGISVNALINLCLTHLLEQEAKENPELPLVAAEPGQAGDEAQDKLF